MIRFVFRLMRGLLLFFIAAVALLTVLVLERAPHVTAFEPPTPEEVIEARAFVRGIRQALNPGVVSTAAFTSDVDELNSVIKLGARVMPGFRGDISTADTTAWARASVPLSVAGITRWVNVTASAPSFEGAFALSGLQVGRLSLPPDLSLELARSVANATLGNNLGDTVLGAASRMDVRGDALDFDLTMDEVGGNGIVRGVFGSMRGAEMPAQGEILRYYVMLRDAIDSGSLPTTGSYLPYVIFMLDAAHAGSVEEGAENAYTSAIFALSMACGARGFNLIVGGVVDGDAVDDAQWTHDCTQLTLNGRIDSRRHFTTAAAIQAASNRGFAISVGEFKELYDSAKSGGFDFTDIAANNSGIRMSNRFMSAHRGQWPSLTRRIKTEQDVIVAFDGIPPIMSKDAFVARFENVESPKYFAQLAEIEARIDALALHR